MADERGFEENAKGGNYINCKSTMIALIFDVVAAAIHRRIENKRYYGS
jgi:hypothetical protein